MNDKTSTKRRTLRRVCPSERPTSDHVLRSGMRSMLGLSAVAAVERPRMLRLLAFLCCCVRFSGSRTYVTTRAEVDGSPAPIAFTKKTLVLDLDETLVHCTFSKIEKADAVLQLLADHREILLYVTIRPGVAELLSRADRFYELVVFTASISLYADPVIDLIDPKKRITLRLFRENCQITQGKLVKDIEQLGRDLSQVIIVDVRHR